MLLEIYQNTHISFYDNLYHYENILVEEPMVNGKNDDEDDDNHETGNNEKEIKKSIINMRLVLAVLVGDCLCNFADGIFVGIAISNCNASIAWAVIGITFYHEVAQELADYFLLTTVGGLRPWKALLINFVTGSSVVLGGLLVLVFDFSNMGIGVLLGLGSGTYFYIASCECIPSVNSVVRGPKDTVISMAMFSLGAIPIGLTLLGHIHCDAH